MIISLSRHAEQNACGCFVGGLCLQCCFPAIASMQGQYPAPIIITNTCGSPQQCVLSGTELSFTKLQGITQSMDIERHGSPQMPIHLHRMRLAVSQLGQARSCSPTTTSQSLSRIASHAHGSSVLLLLPIFGDPAQTPCVCGENSITVNMNEVGPPPRTIQ